MKFKTKLIYIIILFVISLKNLSAQGESFISVTAEDGDGMYSLFKKYDIVQNDCNVNQFCKLNQLKKDDGLLKNKNYFLPIVEIPFDGRTIRSSMGKNDLELAKDIEQFNLNLAKSNKKNHFKKDRKIWIPYHLINCERSPTIPRTHANSKSSENSKFTYEIFGEKNKNVKIKSNKLKGKIFYIESGHGGPDPGAMAKLNNHCLCEDEYAYDVSIRLAKKLIEQGGIVYMIVRDDDGIRDDAYLDCDEDEFVLGDKKIPYNQLERLRQRVKLINALYFKHKKAGVKDQYYITIHVDSRSKKEQVDVFFYYKMNNEKGEALAKAMQSKLKDKYDFYQGEGRYQGDVSSRNLFMLRESRPVTLYVELANIKNEADRKRLTVVQNRELVADWLLEGYLDYFNKQ